MREIIRTVKEFVWVAVTGVALGLAANAQNPNGLTLWKNYFLKEVKPANRVASGGSKLTTQPGSLADSMAAQAKNVSSTDPPPETTTAQDPVAEHIKALGLQPLSHQEAVAIYNSPFRGDGTYVFIDSRDDELYAEGHIPGAYHLYHYYMERYIDEVLEACRFAEKIVVYCHGGQCEDSELTTVDLLNHDVPPHKVFVYTGGMEEWMAKNMPVEKGERSGDDIAGGGGDG